MNTIMRSPWLKFLYNFPLPRLYHRHDYTESQSIHVKVYKKGSRDLLFTQGFTPVIGHGDQVPVTLVT